MTSSSLPFYMCQMSCYTNTFTEQIDEFREEKGLPSLPNREPEKLFSELEIHQDSPLGSGSWGSVYSGLLFLSNERTCDVAVKIAHTNPFSKVDSQQIACREIAALFAISRLASSSFCEPLGWSFDHDASSVTFAIITKKCGSSLLEFMKSPREKLEWKEALHVTRKIAKQIFSALDTLHEELGMIHTDLGPGNVLVDDSYHVTIIDLSFLIYRKASDEERVQPIFCLSVTSPERFVNFPAEASSDIWSAAVLVLGCFFRQSNYLAISSRKYYFQSITDLFGLLPEDPYEKSAQCSSCLRGNSPETGEFDRYFERWKNNQVGSTLSDETLAPLKDLALSCLQLDPKKRPSARVLLEQPFLKSSLNGEDP